MFGIPAWAIEIIIAILKELGFFTWAGALSARLIVAVTSRLEKLKTYHENNDFPQAYPGKTNVTNIN